MRTKRIDALTGIRGLASLWVFIYHYDMHNKYVHDFFIYLNPWVLQLVQKGYLGVDLFFILSGLIISHVHMPEFEQFNLKKVGSFLYLRLSRLLPVHYTLLLITFVVYGMAFVFFGVKANHDDKFNLPDLLLNLTLTQAWTVKKVTTWNALSWSVSAEWFGYLLFPAIAWALTKLTSRRYISALLLIAYTGFYYIMHRWFDDSLHHINYISLLRIGFEFIIGCLLYKLLSSLKNPSDQWFNLLGFCSLLGFSLLIFIKNDILLSVFLAGILASLYVTKKGVTKFLASKLMVYGGEISYSLYLVHYLVIFIMHPGIKLLSKLTGSGVITYNGMFVVELLVTIVCAHLLFYGVEKPANKWLRLKLPQYFKMRQNIPKEIPTC
jgi:peptidoglycan/LPS O-acetylase OafA/YrhL